MSQKIRITMDLDDEFADSGHEMGITEAGYEALVGKLEEFGTDIEVERA